MSAVLTLATPLPAELATGNPRPLPTSALPPLRRLIESRLRRVRNLPLVDRRHGERIPLPVLMQLRPAPGWERGDDTEAIVVAGKDISDQGIGFYHDHAIPYRRGILTLVQADRDPLEVEVDLTWCRFTRLGWYESGGRLVKLVG